MSNVRWCAFCSYKAEYVFHVDFQLPLSEAWYPYEYCTCEACTIRLTNYYGKPSEERLYIPQSRTINITKIEDNSEDRMQKRIRLDCN